MKKYPAALLSALALSALLAVSPVSQADEDDEGVSYPYGEKVSSKAINGLTNIATAFLEVPKNIINTTNDSNVVYGIIGGGAKGLIHMTGRLLTGVVDLVTAPIPTHPISDPPYIWDDFDTDTSYNEVFRLDTKMEETEVVH